MDIHYTWKYQSPFGGMTMAADGTHLTGLWFDNQKHYASTLSERTEERYISVFRDTERWLDTYFSGGSPYSTPPLRLIGTEFRIEVWRAIATIPYGQVTTYKRIADKINLRRNGNGTSARAVGGAAGHNPICLIIPCHRVTGSDGSITGYAGGKDLKEQLLLLENSRYRQTKRDMA